MKAGENSFRLRKLNCTKSHLDPFELNPKEEFKWILVKHLE